MLRLVRLPSLKICTLLLVLLFFYDIFFVFITPLFTKVTTVTVTLFISTADEPSSVWCDVQDDVRWTSLHYHICRYHYHRSLRKRHFDRPDFNDINKFRQLGICIPF